MPPRSKKGKYRKSGAVNKVKVDVLPPQGDPELNIYGYAALLIGAIAAAMLLASAGPALAGLAMPLAVAAVVIFLGVMLLRGTRRIVG